MPKLSKPADRICGSCLHGKQARASYKSKIYQSTSQPLELVHTNLCGPARVQTLQGERYFMLFIDDYTRIIWVTFLKTKSEAFDKFKLFNAKVENESGHKIKCLRSDNGGEFVLTEFKNFCEQNGIKRKYYTSNTPQQNGISETKNRIVQEATRTMLLEAKQAETFWREALAAAVYIIKIELS